MVGSFFYKWRCAGEQEATIEWAAQDVVLGELRESEPLFLEGVSESF